MARAATGAATRRRSSAAASPGCSRRGRCARRRSTSPSSTAPSTTCSSRCSTSARPGILSEGQIAAPLRDVLKRHRNVACVLAEVEDVDVEGRRVVAARPGGDRIELPYDDLIVAAGVRQSYFGHDEYAQWAPGMKTIADALAIRRRVFGAFEMAETADRRRRSGAAGSPSPSSAPARPGSSWPARSASWPPAPCTPSSGTIRPEDARVLLFDGGAAAAGRVRSQAGAPRRRRR